MPEAWHWGFESIAVTMFLYLFCVPVSIGLSWVAVWETCQEIRQGDAPAKWFLGVLIVGLLLRAAWIAYAQPAPISDYLCYWQDALRIAGGDWTFQTIDKHPGIILLIMACIKLFGATYWGVWGMNLLFAGLSLVLLYRISILLLGRTGALVAVLLASCQPQLIAYTALLASESPILFFYLLLTWFPLRFAQPSNTSALLWVALGCTLYAAVLTRSTALLFLFLIPLLSLFRKNNLATAFRQSLAFGLTACLCLSTWLYHQYLLTGQTQLFWGSEIWLVSTTHYETGGRLVNPWRLSGLEQQIQNNVEGLNGIPGYMAALNTMKAWAMPIVRKDPGRYLREGKTRIRHILWTTSETGIRDSQSPSARLSQWPEKTVTRLAEVSKQVWRFQLITGILGFMLLACRRKERTAQAGLLLIGSFLLIWTGFHYLMAVASDRWAVQIIPYVLLFAGGGLVETWQKYRTLNKKQLIPLNPRNA
jgi:4-amino-4-deoxy-L-arabinose transferase-like glycosyltransferase